MSLHPRVFLVLCLAVGLAGCSLFEDKTPDVARLLIEGQAGAQVELITSKRFLSQRTLIYDDQSFVMDDTTIVTVLDADTMLIELPFEQEYDIRSAQQFFAGVRRLVPENDSLHVRAWIDENLKYNNRPQPLHRIIQFIYSFTDLQRDPDDVTA